MLKIFSCFIAMLHKSLDFLASAGLYKVLARMYSICSRVFDDRLLQFDKQNSESF